MDQSKVTVRLDMDDVLNELCMHWMDVHEEKTGERLTTTTWNVHELSDYGEKVYDHFTSKDFYYNVPMKNGADKTVRFLEDNTFFFDYVIVSSCSQDDDREFEYIHDQKIQWCAEKLHQNTPSRFHLVSNGKDDYPADILVDDNLENLLGQGFDDSLKILFTARHNAKEDVTKIGKQENEALLRVDNHDKLQEILKDVMVSQSVKNYIQESNDFFYLHDN